MIMAWKMKNWEMIASWLLVLGGINWGFVGVFGYNLLEAILSSFPTLLQIVYAVVGIAGVFLLIRQVQEWM